MLDVFLTSFRGGVEVPVDVDVLEIALAANGISGEQTTVRTTDGGNAQVLVDTDGASFMIERLTPELSRLLFDVARDAQLVVLPADGTPNAYVVAPRLRAGLPEDIDAQPISTGVALHDALLASMDTRGARTA